MQLKRIFLIKRKNENAARYNMTICGTPAIYEEICSPFYTYGMCLLIFAGFCAHMRNHLLEHTIILAHTYLPYIYTNYIYAGSYTYVHRVDIAYIPYKRCLGMYVYTYRESSLFICTRTHSLSESQIVTKR